ncbi:MAG: hypothetical protein WBM77_07330 [Maribacter sp.]
MKKAVLFIVYICMTISLIAQENFDIVEKGTVLTLGQVSASSYQHIDFPRKNIIIKKGAIANFYNLQGRKVIVEEVSTLNGKTTVILKRKDGRNFFRFWPTVTSDIKKALEKGELKMLEPKDKA